MLTRKKSKEAAKRIMLAGALGSIMLGMSACSYKQTEDAFRQKTTDLLSGNENNTHDQEAASTPLGENTETMEDNVYHIGDEVDYLDGCKTYKVTDVEILDSLKGTDIELTDLGGEMEREDYLIAGDISPEKRMVLATVQIKNVNDPFPTGDYLTTEDKKYPFCIEAYGGTKSEITDPQGPFMDFAVYFSEHGDDKNYYGYYLEPGDEMTCRIGWIVDEEKLEEPFYMGLNLSSNSPYRFIELTKEK